MEIEKKRKNYDFGVDRVATFPINSVDLQINLNKTMKNSTKTILAILATGLFSCAVLSQQAQATPLSGDIQFAGEVHFNTNSLATAASVVTWFDVFHNAGFSSVTSATGDFAVVASGTQATMAAPWTFNLSTPTPGLWSVGGFTFDLSSSSITMQNASTLAIEGTGIVSGNGFDPTNMDWMFTTQSAGGKTRTNFSFSANGAAAPDGGSAVALLGIALSGIEVLRRRLRNCPA
jgi:hypothetical protein